MLDSASFFSITYAKYTYNICICATCKSKCVLINFHRIVSLSTLCIRIGSGHCGCITAYCHTIRGICLSLTAYCDTIRGIFLSLSLITQSKSIIC